MKDGVLSKKDIRNIVGVDEKSEHGFFLVGSSASVNRDSNKFQVREISKNVSTVL